MYNLNMLSTIFANEAEPDWLLIEGEGLGSEYRLSGHSIAAFFNLGIVNIIFFLAGVAFLFYIITAGFSMMTSKGDPKALEAAKARVTSGLMGFIIIFTAYWVVQIVGLLLGVPGFGGVFGS